MGIKEEIEQFLSSMPLNHEFSTRWFKAELSKQFKRSETCYIPSDYCYNRTNKGIVYENQPHYFIKDLSVRGLYKYVGKNYVYNGKVYSKPKKQK